MTSKPRTFGDLYPVTCTPTTLTVHAPLPHLPTEVREAILGWLHEHDLDEEVVIAGTPITRDPEARTLTWTGRERDTAALKPTTRVVMAPSLEPPATREVWPAPFPPIVLEQPRPTRCPTCGTDFETGAQR